MMMKKKKEKKMKRAVKEKKRECFVTVRSYLNQMAGYILYALQWQTPTRKMYAKVQENWNNLNWIRASGGDKTRRTQPLFSHVHGTYKC